MVDANVKMRRGQNYFRDAVINNFGGCCGITGLSLRELLVASHILPWTSHEGDRLNVRNGLCLSRLHDAAFDRGLISFSDDLELILSKRLKKELGQKTVAENFGAYSGESLKLPEDAHFPDPSFLSYHRERIFLRN